MSLTQSRSDDAPAAVGELLDRAVRLAVSDIHLEPTAEGYEVRFRVDGLLQVAAILDRETGRAIVGRLMVLAQLLTYRLDVPQEGRLTFTPVDRSPSSMDLRLAIMPTTHGLRAAVRMPAELTGPTGLDDLGLPAPVLEGLKRFARSDPGMLIVTGPAGAGKTTTIYALLQHIAATYPGLSIVSLEDPVERHIPGVTQIEVKPFGELTYERAMRSMLRQDPQVLVLGEIRDAATATLALQAALSGHRMICTLHASDPAGAISRLLEMRLEPYQISSALFGIVAQRLLRRRAGDGYKGRIAVAEFVSRDEPLRRAILASADSATVRQAYAPQAGYAPLRQIAQAYAVEGITDAAEIDRALGSG